MSGKAQLPAAPASLAAIALGSNRPSPAGTPTQTLHEAVHRLATLGTVLAVSTFHITAPVGFTAQPDFLNAAALLETSLAPLDLLDALLAIELSLGRDRTAAPPKGPRTLDLDLLLYDDLVMATPRLTLPHPEMHRRSFVLTPLAEIAPSLLHPTTNQTISQLTTNH